MKKVLLLAYYFPPMGLGGTQRAAKLAKYLPEFGWNAQVITVKDVAYYAQDPTLLKEIASVPVYRTGSLDPQRILALITGKKSILKTPGKLTHTNNRIINYLQKLLSFFFIPDVKLLWLPFAILQALLVHKLEKFDVLLTTSPPHSIHLAGWLLKKSLKLPWLADFRDSWCMGDFQHEPTVLHRWLNRKLENFIITQADGVVTVSEGLSLKFSSIRTGPTVTITNGFDRDDFVRVVPVKKEKDIRICHCGALSSINNPVHYFHAFNALMDDKPELVDKVESLFIGTILNPVVNQVVHSPELNRNIKLIGNLAHQHALAYLLSSDILLLIISNTASSPFIPGKVFEYLAAQKIILAIIPPGDTAKLLLKSNIAYFAEPGDVIGIKKALQICLDAVITKKVSSSDSQFLNQFDRKNIAGKFANLMEGLEKWNNNKKNRHL